MGKGHHLAGRRQAILTAVEKAGEISVETLSQQFGVSEVTIRQDLQALNEQNLLLRTRGGAVTINALPELSFGIRQQQQARQKALIGRAAAARVRPGDAIVIDASTTAQTMIPYLKQIPELTVITNSIKVAMALLRMPQITVIMPGGTLRRDAVSLVGSPANAFFPGLNARLGFFGARGITLEQGLTDVNLEEARTKHQLVQMCQQVVGILDATKWGKFAVVTFAALDEVHAIITDDGAPCPLVDAVRQHGVDVELVPDDGNHS